MNWGHAMKKLEEMNQELMRAGGEEEIVKQHSKGKMTARERINYLFDTGSFTEMYHYIEPRKVSFNSKTVEILGDGVIVGYGKIKGKLVFASSEDFTVLGGSLGEKHAQKICWIIDKALEMMAPIIFINDSCGARIQEGISALNGYSEIFYRHTQASGVIPQIVAVLGPCAGGACYGPALCDFIFTVKGISKMFITGPEVVKAVTNEDISMDELGDAIVHTTKSGVAHFYYSSEKECLDGMRRLISYLLSNDQVKVKSEILAKHRIINLLKRKNEKILKGKPKSSLMDVVPDNSRKPYDIHNIIQNICDEGSFFEIQKEFAANAVIGFARMERKTIAVISNQPLVMGGALDYDASDKMARFIRFCDCNNIPIVTLVDVPAFWPGKQQEHAGIIRHGAKLIYAYSEASVPKITVILRKAYGGAYVAMSVGADIVFAWPIAEIAVMGAEGATNIISRKRIMSAEDSKKEREICIEEYKNYFLNPILAAKSGYVTEVINPEETRNKLIQALDMLGNKQNFRIRMKGHGNIPL